MFFIRNFVLLMIKAIPNKIQFEETLSLYIYRIFSLSIEFDIEELKPIHSLN